MEVFRYLGSVDSTDVVALLFAAALTGLLFGVAPAWRALQRQMRDAPVQAALRRAGGAVTDRDLRHAEIRCALCPVKSACEGHLRRGNLPPPECPNRALFLSPAA